MYCPTIYAVSWINNQETAFLYSYICIIIHTFYRFVNSLGNILGSKNIDFSLYFKVYKVHLLLHKLVREMCVYSSNEPFRTVAHPNIHDIRTHELLTGSSERMPQVILRHTILLAKRYDRKGKYGCGMVKLFLKKCKTSKTFNYLTVFVWYNGIVDKEVHGIIIPHHRKSPAQPPRRWWFFVRSIDKKDGVW